MKFLKFQLTFDRLVGFRRGMYRLRLQNIMTLLNLLFKMLLNFLFMKLLNFLFMKLLNFLFLMLLNFLFMMLLNFRLLMLLFVSFHQVKKV